MFSDDAYNALNAVARQCNKELKKCEKNDISSKKLITEKRHKKIAGLGFTKTDLLHEVGCINGILTNRRNMY